MKSITPVLLVLAYVALVSEAGAELWRCKNGSYLSHPAPDMKCEKVESSTKCNKDGTRLISASAGTSEECFKQKRDPFLESRGERVPPVPHRSMGESSAGTQGIQSVRSRSKPSYSITDMKPSIEGLSDEEIARRSVHNPMYMQQWASQLPPESSNPYKGMGTFRDMQRDLDAIKRGAVPQDYR